MKICFLIHRRTPLSQAANAQMLANAALALGHETSFAFADSLAYYHGKVQAMIACIKNPLAEDMPFDEMPFADGPLSEFDTLWVLSFGTRSTFPDRMQLLKLLPESVRVINSLDALSILHSKLSQLMPGVPMRCPETHVSCDAGALWDIVKESNAEWVIKPVAESMGRGVFRLKTGDSNNKPLLQAMTDHDDSRYCLLQRYAPEVKQGEKRVLVAGGEVIGQYLRRPRETDHRGNLHQGAEAALCDLSPDEKAGCKRVADWLLKRGVYFAGLDIAWPWLLEWNVVNPGGIRTISRLGGGDMAQKVIKSVIARIA